MHVALDDFRQAHRAILFDIASSATTFVDFKDQVEDYFATTSRSVVREWEEARQAVREQRMTGERLGLGTKRSDSHFRSVVLEIAENS